MATVHHRIITSVEDLVDPLASARMVPMVLRPGAMTGEWARLDLGGVLVEVGEYSFPVATRGETAANRVIVMSPLGQVSGHLNGEQLVPGTLHSSGGSTEVQGVVAGPISVGIVSFPRDELERTAVAMDVEVELPTEGEFRLVPAVDWPRLHHLFDATMRAARAPLTAALGPAQSQTTRETLLEVIVRAFDPPRLVVRPATGHLNSMRITRACEDYANASRFHDVSLAALCVASGSSERRVRHAFYECYRMSPTAYLRVAALHHVRRALLDGPPRRDAVSRAAADFGFWHLSRFAGQYRALFGESPSMTLGLRSSELAG